MFYKVQAEVQSRYGLSMRPDGIHNSILQEDVVYHTRLSIAAVAWCTVRSTTISLTIALKNKHLFKKE